MDELSKGKFDIHDTTEYMKNTLVVWEELGFRFDAISTGFIVSKEQTELITEFCKEKAGSGVVIEKAEENMVNCREAGALECPECKTRFIPTMKNYVMVAHTLTKRKLVCPNCGTFVVYRENFCIARSMSCCLVSYFVNIVSKGGTDTWISKK